MTDPVIEIRNLEKTYNNGFPAVKDISFEVYRDEIFGILGPNGAGKTSTLEMIECLKEPSSGKLSVLGFDSRTQSKEIKKKIGAQLQSSEYLNDLNLSELLRLFASFYQTKINPLKILDRVGLEDKAKSQVKELSGGQKQRFTIATALVHTPEILILDEPTTGLDPHARREMWELIKELNSQNMTVLLTTHYMEEAEYLCDRVAIMDSGKILKLDQPQKLIQDLSKTYRLSFFADKKIEPDFFKGISGINKVAYEHPRYALEIDKVEALNFVLEKLSSNGIRYKFLNLKTANLEDVYLELTGREYEA